jgi:hypothetical protein
MLFLGGCVPDRTTALIEKPLSVRPIVGVNTVIDHTRHDLSWDISQELSSAIRLHLSKQENLYLLSEHQIATIAQKLAKKNYDPFSGNTEWLKKMYPQNEFVAFFELIEHQENPISAAENAPAELLIALKVHVFDLRADTPKVVLQEIVQQSHHVPMQFTKSHNNQVPWGDETFEISPLGLAHDQLCQEVASRIEDYILLSCEKS